MVTERRRSDRHQPRVRRLVPARISLDDGPEKLTHAYIADLSPTGLQVNFDNEIAPETRFLFLCPLAAFGPHLEGELKARCRVVWTRPLTGGTCVHGLEFEALDQETQRFVEELLERFAWDGEHDLRRLPNPVDLKVMFPGEEAWTPLLSARQLSTWGLEFRCHRPLDSGERLRVRLLLDVGTVDSAAEVAWSRQLGSGNYDTGCFFLDLRSGQRDFIELHMRRFR